MVGVYRVVHGGHDGGGLPGFPGGGPWGLPGFPSGGLPGFPGGGPWGKSSGGGGARMGAVDGTCGRPHPLFLAFGPAEVSLPPPPITSDNGENVK